MILTRLNTVFSLCKYVKTQVTTQRSFKLGTLFRKPTLKDLKIADKIPEHYTLIYRNGMYRYLLGAHIVSVVGTGTILLYVLGSNLGETGPKSNVVKWSPTARSSNNEELVYVTALILILIVSHWYVSRTPIRIYKVPGTKKYISFNYGKNYLGKQRYDFQCGEVTKMPETGIMPWKGDKYFIQKENDSRAVILLEDFFKVPADLYIMLGVQRDPELEE